MLEAPLRVGRRKEDGGGESRRAERVRWLTSRSRRGGEGIGVGDDGDGERASVLLVILGREVGGLQS